jgi:hypothetical protein
MGRKLVAATALLAATVAAGASMGGSGEAARRPVALLPDLAQSTPKVLRISRAGNRWRLGFLSAVLNAGRGPLIIRGRRASTLDPTMDARQLIRRSDGTTAVGRRIGTMRYVTDPTHSHWHLMRFQRYELRGLRGRLVAPGRKVGFCLTDSSRDAGDEDLPGERAEPTYRQDCGPRRPDLLQVAEGISIGWMDVYAPLREGQYVDITDVRSGRYVLVHRVNVSRRIRERKRSNNASSLLIRISWPNGRSSAPTVRTLAACFYTARCRR